MKLIIKNTPKYSTMISVFLLALSGCSTNRALYGGADRPPLLKGKAITTFNYTSPKATNYYMTHYTAAKAGDDQDAARNEILNDIMKLIDYNYHEFENHLRGDKTVQEMGADMATLGLTAAATVVGGAETKTILSAIATGVVGVNASIDKEMFENNTIQALQLQMRAMRSAVETKLNAGMKQTSKDYPLEYGLRDIIAYYYAGSLNDALIGLVQNSSSDAQTNQNAAAAAR